MNRQDVHLNTGAAALHALPAQEWAVLQERLATDEVLSAEYSGFLETAALLGAAAAEPPPAAMRPEVMRLITITRQLPPLPATSDEPSPAVPVTATAPDLGSSDEPSPVVNLAARRRRSWVLAAAAAVLVAGGTVLALNRDQEPAPMAAEACVARASDRMLLPMGPEPGEPVPAPPVPVGNAVTYSPSCGAVTLTMPDLAPLPTDRGYQLWVQESTEMEPVAMMDRDEAGHYLPMTVAVTPGLTLGVTVEPMAGSDSPTGDPIMVVTVPK